MKTVNIILQVRAFQVSQWAAGQEKLKALKKEPEAKMLSKNMCLPDEVCVEICLLVGQNASLLDVHALFYLRHVMYILSIKD